VPVCTAGTDYDRVAGGQPLPRVAARTLAAAAVAYALFHHVGTGLGWLGAIGSTRWADWADLLTPYAFLLPAVATIRFAQGGPASWLVFLTGAITYVEGHGIHLAANSIANAAPGDAAHLWDEVVGHYLWFSGAMLVWAALALTAAPRTPVAGPIPIVLAVAVGATAATNALEGGTAVLGLAAAAGFTGWGWRTRRRLGRCLIVAFAPAVLILVGYGWWNGGFPQPSQLGWPP
jgi:hypothetical protein